MKRSVKPTRRRRVEPDLFTELMERVDVLADARPELIWAAIY